jgi:hypothetical protein
MILMKLMIKYTIISMSKITYKNTLICNKKNLVVV